MSLANTARPKKFADVVGQESETAVLKKIVEQDWNPPSLLITGPFGCGKTSLARLLARAKLCTNRGGQDGTEPCGTCSSCKAIDLDNHPCYTELDSASHGQISDIRAMKEALTYAIPGKTRIIYYDECLTGDTRIKMADGKRKRISTLVKEGGDQYVLSWNTQTKKIEPKKVKRFLTRSVRNDLLEVSFWDSFEGARKVTLTPDHKVWAPDLGDYVPASILKEGDKVLLENPYALSELQKEVMRGSLLGDSYVDFIPSGLARFCYLQSEKQKEYFAWKHLIFKRLTRKEKVEREVNRGWGDYVWRAQTRALGEVTELASELYNQGRRSPTKEYLDKLTWRGIAVWYMDDGGRTERGDVRLSTYSFTKEENYLIADWFKERYHIDFVVDEDSRGKGFFLRARQAGSTKFLRKVTPHLIPSMNYKGNGENSEAWEQESCPGWSLSRIEKIKKITTPKQTYDLEVEDNHNFFAERWLVSNCHMISQQGQNALLTTLEEGHPDTTFIFASTEAHKLLPTIRSRSIELRMKLLTAAQIAQRLGTVAGEHQITIEPRAAALIATYVRGHLRDALIYLDTLKKMSPQGITEDLVRTYLRLDRTDDIYKLLTQTDPKEGFQHLELLLCEIPAGELCELIGEILIQAYKQKLGIKTEIQADEAWLKRVQEAKGQNLLEIAERILSINTDFATLNFGLAAIGRVLYDNGSGSNENPRPNGAQLAPTPLIPAGFRKPPREVGLDNKGYERR